MVSYQDVPLQWDASIRAPVRRRSVPFSPWLREEDGGQSLNPWVNPCTNHGIGIAHNQCHFDSNLQTMEKGDIGVLKRKFISSINEEYAPVISPHRGRMPNLLVGAKFSSLDMAMDQDEENNPITCQDGLKRPRNVSTSSMVFDHLDSSNFSNTTSAGLVQ
ncbi:hypothetical protein V6N13_028532 [Hibiscus sabdariffa]